MFPLVPPESPGPLQGGDRGDLAHGRRLRAVLCLYGGDTTDKFGRPEPPADPPAGHRVRLGDAVDEQDPLAQIRRDLCDADVLALAVADVGVDLVRKDHRRGVPSQDLGETGQGVMAVGGARGISGSVEHDPACACGQGRFQGVGSESEPRVGRAGNDHGHGAAQAHQVRVTCPVGRRNDHLVARAQGGEERVEDDLLGAASHGHLGIRVTQGAVPFHCAPCGTAQFRYPVGGGVAQRAGSGFLSGTNRVRRRGEVGLAEREVDDPTALRAILGRAAGHLQDG